MLSQHMKCLFQHHNGVFPKQKIFPGPASPVSVHPSHCSLTPKLCVTACRPRPAGRPGVGAGVRRPLAPARYSPVDLRSGLARPRPASDRCRCGSVRGGRTASALVESRQHAPPHAPHAARRHTAHTNPPPNLAGVH